MDHFICSAIIVAAGSGTRMGGPVPKQFIKICGKPVLAHTLEAFENCGIIDDIVIVTAKDSVEYCIEAIVGKYGFTKVRRVVPGGETRCFSVKNGLSVCENNTDYVFIHDGVRAMITDEVIRRGYEDVLKFDSAVAAVQSKDTVRITDKNGNVTMTPPRELVRSIQTPQIFSYRKLYNAYLKMTEEEMRTFTDDGMVWEKYSGKKLHLFEGALENIKITTPEDLIFAEKYIKQ